jgi:hypothetical protein
MCKARRGRASRHHSPGQFRAPWRWPWRRLLPGKRGLGRDSNYCESIARRNSTRGIVERVSCRICATFPTYNLYWYLFLIPADGAYKQKSLEWYPCRPVLLFLDFENHMRVFDTECQLTATPVYNSASRLIALAVTSLSAQKGKRNQQAKSELASRGQYYRDVLVCSSRRRWPSFSRGSEACG